MISLLQNLGENVSILFSYVYVIVKVIGDKYKFKLTLLNTSTKYGSVKVNTDLIFTDIQSFAWRPSLDIKIEGPIIPSYLVAVGLSSGIVKLTR